MERQILHSTETVWEMLAREEWLGCRHDAHGRHTRVNTSVGTVYVFLIFNTKPIRIMFSRSICIMKGHWWFLPLSWLDDDQGTFLTAHDVFFKEMKNPQIYG